MTIQRDFTLCGGTFFVLLLQARKQRTAARKNLMGMQDGLSDSDLFEALIRVAFPDYISPAGRSIKTYTSNYKACKLSANEYLPFNNTELVNIFDQRIKDDYKNVLNRMCEFTASFIDENNMGSWLVRAILETISHDRSITDELFYVEGGSQAIDKKHLLALQEVTLQPFLLGIWHFIITQRQNNKIGSNTFENWHSPASTTRGKREFISDVGKGWNKSIRVNLVSSDIFFDKKYDEPNYSGDVPTDMDALLYEGGIAPELTGDAPWILIPKGILPSSSNDSDFAEYLNNTYNKYSKIKTLLYSDTPRNFYSFYVCNDVSQKIYIKNSTYRTKTIHNATVETLRECSNFVLISGTGGLGKSMMMRHLLLDSIESFDSTGKIPIFIPLKDYNDSYPGLLEYIYEKFEGLGGADNINDFTDLLTKGECLLLFDGLDEIKSDYRKKYEHDLELFADKYTENMFVISSRPTGSFVSLNRFTILDLCPFNKKQALELIDKLEFRPDEPIIKRNFRDEVDKTLFITHREFTQNPLLLTIMLMTFEQFAEIPSKMHIFYREAYVALSQKHDASKGAYKRVLNTGLTADQFSDYFAEFCARSYRDEKFEFTDVLFDKYFNSLHERNKGSLNISASDFRTDLVENMCLMYYEGGKYHFTHRSFQEYFCALYFSKQKDKTLQRIGDFFENKRSRNYTDKTFNMLYDMIPEKIEEYIFAPFLTSLFNECDENDGYWTFLQRMYPVLYYENGETNGYSENEPESFLYDSIVNIRFIKAILGHDDLPFDECFITNEWVYLDEKYNDPDIDTDSLIDIEDVPWDYIEKYGEPEIVGRNYEIHIDEIVKNPNSHKDLISLLDNDNFPLKAEFLEVRQYMQELIDRQEVVGDDLFDLFQ